MSNGAGASSQTLDGEEVNEDQLRSREQGQMWRNDELWEQQWQQEYCRGTTGHSIGTKAEGVEEAFHLRPGAASSACDGNVEEEEQDPFGAASTEKAAVTACRLSSVPPEAATTIGALAPSLSVNSSGGSGGHLPWAGAATPALMLEGTGAMPKAFSKVPASCSTFSQPPGRDVTHSDRRPGGSCVGAMMPVKEEQEAEEEEEREEDNDTWQELDVQATHWPREASTCFMTEDSRIVAPAIDEPLPVDSSSFEGVHWAEFATQTGDNGWVATSDDIKREALARTSAQQAEEQASQLEEALNASPARSSANASSPSGASCKVSFDAPLHESATLHKLLQGPSSTAAMAMRSHEVEASLPSSVAAADGQQLEPQQLTLQQGSARSQLMAPPAEPRPAAVAAEPQWDATPPMPQRTPQMYWSPAAPIRETLQPVRGHSGGGDTSTLAQGSHTLVVARPVPPWRRQPVVTAPSSETIAKAAAQAEAHPQHKLQDEQQQEADFAVTRYRWQLVQQGFPPEVVQTYVDGYSATVRNDNTYSDALCR